MKSIAGLSVSAILIGLSCAPAQAGESGWYVAAGGTVSLLQDSHTQILNLPTPAGHAETDNAMSAGPGFQLAAGHSFGHARLEIEGGYARNKSGHYVAIVPPTGRIAAEGGHKAWRLMANGYYDFGDGRLKPYLGAGAGYASIKARLFSARPPFPNEPPLLILNDRKGEFAWQAMAGAAYELSPGIALTAQYRWFSAGKVHLRDLSGFEHVREHKGHNVDVGVRFGF